MDATSGNTSGNVSHVAVLDFLATHPHGVSILIILRFILPPLLVLGCFGNMTCFFVLWKMSKHVFLPLRYLALMCLAEIIVLLIHYSLICLSTLLDTDLPKQLLESYDVTCHIVPFVVNFARHSSRWLLVAFVTELSLRIDNRPSKTREMFCVHTVILTILLFVILLNAHFFWTYMRVLTNEPTGVNIYCGYAKFGIAYNKSFQEEIWPLLDVIIHDVVPVVCVATGIVTIAIHHGRHKNQSVRLDCVKTACIAIAVLFVVFCTPTAAVEIWQYATLGSQEDGLITVSRSLARHLHRQGQVDSQHTKKLKEILICVIASLLDVSFVSIKFAVLTATSLCFREEALAFVTFKWCRKCIARCIRSDEGSA